MRHILLPSLLAVALALPAVARPGLTDLRGATVLVRPEGRSNPERAAAEVLVEEVAARTGIQLPVAETWPESGPVIAISGDPGADPWGQAPPRRAGETLPERKPEGFRLFDDGAGTVWVLGADGRGALYGVGALLRQLRWGRGQAELPAGLDIATAPVSSIRGHQLGYRATANSYDAWTIEQYDQYIRELAFFGINSIENIPFHDVPSPLMKVGRREMNRGMSAICERYGLDYWVWTAANYDLGDAAVRAEALEGHRELYDDCTELTGVFFPGGDPGSNPPQRVMPFLEDIAALLLPRHPDARVWLSLQGFDRDDVDFVMDYLRRESPDWLGGLVAGPGAPSIPATRLELPERYRFRLYPDITHNKLCQYPVPWWDQALALTLGREAINPRPTHYAYIHNWFAPSSDGFIAYSDGCHDDVNKTVWSSLAWDPDRPVNTILEEYGRVFFGPGAAVPTRDGLLALENNWQGPLRDNGAVVGTWVLWEGLERAHPELARNWRWQMCALRAVYDAYTRRRLLHETALEEQANVVMARCETLGAETAMAEALALVNAPMTDPADLRLRKRIDDLCDALFQSCGLQTSVPRYQASGAERGAILDFVDYPLNNRWWLEDTFKTIRALPAEAERCARLKELAAWANPGPGSFYDDIGNPANCPHVRRSPFPFASPGEETVPEPTLWWWDSGKSRARLSWQVTMRYPEAVVYEGLCPDAAYTVRCGGFGQFLLRIDGELVGTPGEPAAIDETRDFPVPPDALADGKLVLTWDVAPEEDALNWRQQSRLAEVWLLKR